jgi:hypothetical protein
MMPAEMARVAALQAPLLCFDTCTVLDIMRDPTRETARAHESQAALDLLAAIESGTKLIALMADQVGFEFGENAKAVEEEATKSLKKLRDQLARIDAVAAVFGGVGQTSVRHLDDHTARARAIVDRWMAAATPAKQQPDIASRAFVRLNQARTPAQKGKDSMKDCVVIETYLDIVAKLRSAGLTAKAVFVSSNTADYTGETRKTLKSDLAAEFAVLGMEYAPNLAAAKHFLGV